MILEVNNMAVKPWANEEVGFLTTTTHTHNLIVWNDEVNTFEHVIETLIEICNHNFEQAEQCALLIHTKGKYAVKHGYYDTLRAQKEAITERGINATIEEIF